MRLTAKKEDLIRALQQTGPLVPRKSPLPILACVLLRADQDGLRLSATDLETCVDTDMRACVEEAGAVAVPARDLLDTIRDRSDTEVRMEAKGSTLTLSSLTGQKRIPTLPADEFPVGDPEGDSGSTLDAMVLPRLSDVAWAVAAEGGTRPILAGIEMVVQDRHVTFSAANGYKGARCCVPAPFPPETAWRGVLPLPACTALLSVTKGHDEARVTLGKDFVEVFCGRTRIRTRLRTEGRFPDLRAILPPSFRQVVTTNRRSLLDALKRLTKSAPKGSSPYCVQTVLGDGSLALRPYEWGDPEDCEILPAHNTGGSMTIGFNGRYLRDVLQGLKGRDVRISVNDPLALAIFTAEDAPGVSALLMPMRMADPSRERRHGTKEEEHDHH